jgi:hypothetical protein
MELAMDAVLDGGGTVNEDRYTVLDGISWVLDGTSGFGDRRLTSHPESDGVWFVETVDEYLRAHAQDSTTLPELVAGAIEHVMKAFIHEVESTVSPSADIEDAIDISEVPAATIALARWDESENRFEYYSLGDAAVLVHTTDGTVDYHDEGGPKRFDGALRERVTEYVDSNPTADYEEIQAELYPKVRQFRKHREVPGGFWCLGINPVSAYQGVTGEYALDTVADVTLFTDGFTQALELFELYEDWNAAVEAISDHGVEAVVTNLRADQRREDIHEQPRIKPADDIAVVNLDFSR